MSLGLGCEGPRLPPSCVLRGVGVYGGKKSFFRCFCSRLRRGRGKTNILSDTSNLDTFAICQPLATSLLPTRLATLATCPPRTTKLSTSIYIPSRFHKAEKNMFSEELKTLRRLGFRHVCHPSCFSHIRNADGAPTPLAYRSYFKCSTLPQCSHPVS